MSNKPEEGEIGEIRNVSNGLCQRDRGVELPYRINFQCKSSENKIEKDFLYYALEPHKNLLRSFLLLHRNPEILLKRLQIVQKQITNKGPINCF